jgi:hypothetical protein
VSAAAVSPAELFDRELLRAHARGEHRGDGCRLCPACWTPAQHQRERIARAWPGAVADQRARHERERADVAASLVGRSRDVYRRRAA